ncbi:hypothetical protein Trydic_g15646 [Trypoxylus dichotomus]
MAQTRHTRPVPMDTTSAHSHTIHRQTFPQNFHFEEFQQYDPEPYCESNCLEYHNENDPHECSTPPTDLYSEPPHDSTECHPEENLHPYASQDDENFRMIASNQKSKDYNLIIVTQFVFRIFTSQRSMPNS